MKISSIIQQSIDLKTQLLTRSDLMLSIQKSIDVVTNCFRHSGQVLFCGNGGSAADAQHLAAEFSGRFYFDRKPLNAEALHVNTSYITAVANDYSYDQVYSRIIEAKGKKGDILFGISTSGNSSNVIKAMAKAKELGMITIGMTGLGGGQIANISDILLDIPSTDTPRIQECHILLGHIICQMVEENLFNHNI